MADARWVPIATLGELLDDDVVGVQAAGRELAVYRVQGEVYVTDDRCTHGDARLSEGFVIDGCVECPFHQGQFDIRTGEPLCTPVTEPIRTYPVLVEGDAVLIALPEDA